MKKNLDEIVEKVEKSLTIQKHGTHTYITTIEDMTLVASYTYDGAYVPGYEDVVDEYNLTIVSPKGKNEYSCLMSHGCLGGDRKVVDVYRLMEKKYHLK